MDENRQQNRRQRGNAILISIVMMMALSLMTLKALHYQQENAMRMMFDEQKYLNAFQQAESSLAWGAVQSWVLDSQSQQPENWQCVQKSDASLHSCLKYYQGDLFLLKGIGLLSDGEQADGEQIAHYQWMKQVKDSNQDTLIPVKSGWLDFCPVISAEFCL
ncbi:MAG: YgdB family protein [Enterobacteriaceae bacterium]|nr:YgdB family protein [Enterobacteriaceae bacterium]